MKNFKFKYEKILELAERKEKNIKDELHLLYKKINKEKSIMDQFIDKEKNCFSDLKNNLSLGCKSNQLRSINHYINELKSKILYQGDTINFLEKEINLTKEKLIRITQEKKMMEKLKDRDLDDYKLELKLIEEKTIDQLVTYSNSLRR